MIQMLVQVAAGSCDRKIYDERSLEYLETRPGTLPYPYPYGFIIGTSAEDGACVDCYLITSDPVTSGAIVECEPAGLLLQDEGGEIDHKVMAVLTGQPVMLEPELVEELQKFIYAIFSNASDMEIRVGPLLSRDAAMEYLQRSLEDAS